jgi:hypothetical protein
MVARFTHTPARNPQAAPICLLTQEWAERRVERPDTFLDLAASQTWIEGGAEYHFAAKPGMWERAEVFVREEGECCPFLAFSLREDAEEIVLRIIWPEEVWK